MDSVEAGGVGNDNTSQTTYIDTPFKQFTFVIAHGATKTFRVLSSILIRMLHKKIQ